MRPRPLRSRRTGAGVIAAAALAALAVLAPTAQAAPTGWVPAGGDEFNAPALNTSTWKTYDSVGAFGNGLRRPSAISQGNGLLTITAQPRLNGGTSGGMAMGAGQLYGRWEFRARTSAGKGYSSAILLWPDSEKFPEDGELDMMEVPSEKRTAATAFVHYGADNRIVGTSRAGDFTKWHDFAMEWLPDRITWYVDGVKAWETTDKKVIPTTPMHLCIQLDQGPATNWMPAPDASTPDKVTLQVDWARISKRG
ncbi:glycosyl hydrolase family 16 [Pseudonocardia sediminis]|uniref:Glycosyl hydrolase family 16 n=1 Tax=Pseudonocardia sediminis TaxID=1397368 RepID=A0A4Q7UTF6_PSEST|nr:glycoside hydrolase family 16 protein [Pseudonocardia sediminis]RZT84138.1 glycosyl hydrolase family 16 [Pseudonocardia sediminis]